MSPTGDARDQARNLLTLRRFEEARQIAMKTLSEDASDVETMRLLADIELADGNTELALEHARNAVGVSASAASYLTLASVERRSGDYAACIAACERGLNFDPGSVSLHVNHSLAWSGPWLKQQAHADSAMKMAAAKNARTAAEIALDLDPTNTAGYYAASVAALVRDDPFSAAQVLEKGLALNPEWPEGHLLMSGVRGRQGMVKLASRHLAIAGRLAPSDDAPLEGLRLILGKRRRAQGRVESAWWIAPEARQILEADAELGGHR